MSFIEAFLMALALSADALVCAAVTGKRRFAPAARMRCAMQMALTFGLFQALMPVAGFYAGAGIVAFIHRFDHWAAFCLLTAVSLKMLKDALSGDKPEEECCRISLTALLMLGIATSIDALALGFSIGLIYDTILFFALLTGITCALITICGFIAGQWLSTFKSLDKVLNTTGALVLLGIGMKILIEHQVFV